MSSTSSSSSSSSSTSSPENTIASDSENRSSQVGISTLRSQEPTNYGSDLETSVYEDQIRSGYRLPMHPYTIAFFNYYNMAPAQLVPNGWRKLLGLIYLVRTSGYPTMVHDFMRLYLEDYEKKGFLAPDAHTKKFLDHIKRRGALCIDEPFTDQELRHAGLIHPTPVSPLPPTPVVESRVVLGHESSELAVGASSFRTPSIEMFRKVEGAKGDFLGLLQKASKGKRKEGTGEGSSPLIKRPSAPTPPVPPVVVEDLSADQDPIFRPRWTIRRGDFGMPSSHVSTQHLAHGVLLADQAYCYSSQMQDRFNMTMDVARTAETEKRAAVGKADKLDKEVKGLKVENTDLITKLGRLEKRSEKLRLERLK
ncbi:hypothetical protein RJ639_045156 [Escallonia herrerae]|uniref:Transposase (putative) gypsy type domain-containing protein n=1 Tax=Escallonia herrerae TaxID=1293975 RepID=A0AA88W7J2_9ASTE|nr:hypothetical protein RJ639_045156 [Escallonia herrerae]